MYHHAQLAKEAGDSRRPCPAGGKMARSLSWTITAGASGDHCHRPDTGGRQRRVGDVGRLVLKERRLLSEEGLVVVTWPWTRRPDLLLRAGDYLPGICICS
ncbi:MAG: hypothetical protein R2874_01725 [Desulfobacterales bacterium]